MSILNDLFEQIIQSEERIRERFSKIREVNNEIQVCQMKFQDAEDELKSLTGSLVLKNQRLAEEELKFKWFAIREKVLQEKIKELLERKDCLRAEKDIMEKTIEGEREKFTVDVRKFMSSYDFCGKGQEERNNKATHLLQELCQEEMQLEKDIASMKQNKEKLASLVVERDKLLVATTEKESALKDLTVQFQTAVNQTTNLETEKQRVSHKPQNDTEFKRLSEELEAMKDDTMEGICEALTQELLELQQGHLKSTKAQNIKQQQQQVQNNGRQQQYPQQVQSQRTMQNKGRMWRDQLNKRQYQNFHTD